MRDEKILVVDHDPLWRKKIWKTLQTTGVFVYQSDSIEQTIDIMSRVDFDLFLLDSSLVEEQDGYFLAHWIRQEDPLVPILFYSEHDTIAAVTAGLEAGADFYLSKSANEQILRVQVLTSLNRAKVISEHRKKRREKKMVVGDFSFDHSRYQFFKKGKPLLLSSKESQLLQFFLENPDQVFSKEEIYTRVWHEAKIDENTVMVFINHLRNKIEDDPKKTRYLKTIWGIGYTFLPDGV